VIGLTGFQSRRMWDEGQRELINLLASLRISRAQAEARNDLAAVTLINANQFAALFNYDLRQLLFDIGPARDTWGGKLYARTLALTLYECTEDFTSILGRDFRGALQARGGSEHLARLGELHNWVREFFNAHRVLLQGIRLQVIGHREHDASQQLARLEAIDVRQIEELGYEMLRWLNEFIGFATVITSLLNRG
jgi:hypothetical protein